MQTNRRHRFARILAGIVLVLTYVASSVSAAESAAAPYTWGGDLRFRNEYFNNAFALDDTAALHEQDYFRFRGRLWLTANPSSEFTLFARAAAEPRNWTRSAFVKQHTGTGTEWRFGILDSLNVKWKTSLDGTPVTVTVGRQDITFGETANWWLVADGTPGDGSWTTYFDAGRVTVNAKVVNTQFDFIGIGQRAHPDSNLAVVGDPLTYSVTEQNERGFIAYATNKSLADTQLDAYFIYKGDSKSFSSGDNADIFTYGAKVVGALTPEWRYSVEGALQNGNKQDSSVKTPVAATGRRDISAYGLNAKLTHLFKDSADNQLSLVAEYLSGDNPNSTDKDEMFDILWGRWPRFSEAYIFSYAMETSGKLAQINNIERLGVNWTSSPVKNMTISATYNALFAPRAVPTRAINTALFSCSGHNRGNFVQFVIKQKFSSHLSALLWAEYLRQGSFYTHHSNQTFYRAEVVTTF